MNHNRLFQLIKRPGRIAAVLLLAVFLFVAFADVSYADNPPTVNGQFYGDGDEDRYIFYSVSDRGSELYYRLDGGTLYVALVTKDVNDNVFGNQAYMADAGWGQPYREARRLFDSEYMAFSLTACGQTWSWQQGYGRQPEHQQARDHTNTEATWVSNTTIATGLGTPPPGFASSSSLVWNMNNYATRYQAGTLLFNMDVNGSGPDNWKSAHFNNGDIVPDWDLGYSATYEWEWPMVYEWSVPLTAPSCAGQPIQINTTSSHHSPPKDGGDQNDPIDPPPSGNTLTDWGDLPTGYPTTLAEDGARHIVVVGGAYLGVYAPDVEPDGKPSPLATGDDAIIPAPDDEDGVQFLSGFTWSGVHSGWVAPIEVTAGTNGCLSAFMDLNGDGTLSQVYVIAADGSVSALSDQCILAGVHNYSILVYGTDEPGDLAPQKFARFRFTNSSGQGGASPTGLASTGEVEDYLIAGPTAITLRNVSTSGSSAGLAAVLIVALVGLGLTSLYVFNRRQRAA